MNIEPHHEVMVGAVVSLFCIRGDAVVFDGADCVVHCALFLNFVFLLLFLWKNFCCGGRLSQVDQKVF